MFLLDGLLPITLPGCMWLNRQKPSTVVQGVFCLFRTSLQDKPGLPVQGITRIAGPL
jgi:hypothetical protein